MSKRKKQSAPSPQTREEAHRIAKATQRPGQTKEQTRLISQGIEKGIEQYKKQQKAKAREQDKQRKKERRQQEDETSTEDPGSPGIRHRVPWLPWLLLLATWAGIGAYFGLR